MSRHVVPIPADAQFFGGYEHSFELYRYAPAVRAGNLLFISGQIAVQGDRSCPEGVNEQTEIAFQRTFEILRWVGLTKEDLVEFHSYHVDLPKNFELFSEVKDRHLSASFPGWTAIGVDALALPQVKIELRSVAAFRS